MMPIYTQSGTPRKYKFPGQLSPDERTLIDGFMNDLHHASTSQQSTDVTEFDTMNTASPESFRLSSPIQVTGINSEYMQQGGIQNDDYWQRGAILHALSIHSVDIIPSPLTGQNRERTPREEFYALTQSLPESMREYARNHFEQNHFFITATLEQARELAQMYLAQNQEQSTQ